MRQRPVKWIDVRIGEAFRIWGSDIREYHYVKVSETASIQAARYEEYKAAVKRLPEGFTSHDLRGADVDLIEAFVVTMMVIDRPIEDRIERYGVLR